MNLSDAPPQSQRTGERRKRSLKRWLDEAAGLILSSALAALCILFADRMVRPSWDFSWRDHWMGAPILFLAPAALLGFFWANVTLLQDGVSRRYRNQPRRRDWTRGAVVAGLAAIGSIPTALKTFSGAKVGSTWLGRVGPVVFVGAVLVGVLLATVLLWRAQRQVAWGRRRGALLLALGYMVAAAAALWTDIHVYQGLYSHLHAFLELCAFGFLVGAFQLTGFVLLRARPFLVWANRIVGLALVLLGIAFVGVRPFRNWTDARLAHAWVDEFYVGRALRRAQLIELKLTGGDTLRMARIDQIALRFGIKDRSLAPAYKRELELREAPPEVRNIVFFYVDTLRADVAADPGLMPHLMHFRARSLDFQRAYSPGSDTQRALPTITRGNYFLDKTHQGDLLRLAKKRGHKSHLVVAKSASEFLKKVMPSFAFDTTTEVSDYDEGEEVWGYGAHISTAAGVGDTALEFLKKPESASPFLLWLFHFDVHAWREIDQSYIESTRRRLGVSEQGKLDLRYRVIAASIDEQFGRVLNALKAAGREKDTAVVFVSDHGEGMGQGGFWVHSVFLWESLIHVPLVVHIPGEAPAVVRTPVSLVDLAPTLAPILGADRGLYHGDDLRDLAQGAPRRLPLLSVAGRFEGHDRSGIIDAESGRKLVMRLEAAFPELIAYDTDPFDYRNLARKEPHNVKKLLKELARSPLFPRKDSDFDLRPEPEEQVIEAR